MPDILLRLRTRSAGRRRSDGDHAPTRRHASGAVPRGAQRHEPRDGGAVHRAYVTVVAECISSNTFGGTSSKLPATACRSCRGLNRAGRRLARQSRRAARAGRRGAQWPCHGAARTATYARCSDIFVERCARSPRNVRTPSCSRRSPTSRRPGAHCSPRAPSPTCPVFVSNDVRGVSAARSFRHGPGKRRRDPGGVRRHCGRDELRPRPRAVCSRSSRRWRRRRSCRSFVQPNAGLPTLVDGVTAFPGTADEMGAYAARFVRAGAAMVGSCCGSSPSFTGAIAMRRRCCRCEWTASGPPVSRCPVPAGRCGSARGRPLVVVGERNQPDRQEGLAGLAAGRLHGDRAGRSPSRRSAPGRSCST